MLQCASLVVAIHDEHHAASIHDGADAYCEGSLGYLVHVVVEEARVGYDSVLSESLLSGERSERRTRLVESDVSVGTDTTHKEVDATVGSDLSLIVGTLLFEVFGIAVEDIHIFLLDVDVSEEVERFDYFP